MRLESLIPSVELILYLLNLAVAMSLTCAAGLLATRVFRRGSVPLRHGILVGTLTLVLLSPAAVWLAQRSGLAVAWVTVSARPGTLGPPIGDWSGVGVPDAVPSAGRSASARETASSDPAGGRPPGASSDSTSPGHLAQVARGISPPTAEIGRRRPLAFSGTPVAPSKTSSLPTGWQVIGAIAAWVWAVGAAIGLFRLGRACAALVRFCRTFHPLTEPGRRALVCRAAGAVGLRKLPLVLVSRAASVPVSMGLFRPAVVLPEAMLREADEEQLLAVLLHEMAHVARRDHWVGVGMRIASVLFWWNPLVRRVSNETSDLREEICDNYVVLIQGEGLRLARFLVDLAARVTAEPLLPSTIGMMESRLTGITGRVIRLLDKERNMETRMSFRSRTFVLICAAFLLAVMGTVGGLRFAHAQPAAEAPVAAAKEAATNAAAEAPARSPGGDRLGSHRAAEQGKVPETAGNGAVAGLSAIQKALAKKYPALDVSKLTEAAIRGMLQSLNDPYAEYYSTDQMADLQRQLSGRFVGIGVELVKKNNHIFVQRVFAGSPAKSAGVQPDDELQLIDGKSVTGDINDASKMIRGAADTTVEIKVRKKEGAVVAMHIKRRPLELPAICGLWLDEQGKPRYWLDPAQKLAYVQIASVGEDAAAKARALIEELKKEELKGLVLDLRDCPGGLLSKALDIVGLFQKGGLLLTVKEKDSQQTFAADGKNWLGDFPVVILVNGATASSGEMIAGVLQDRGRAVLVGDRTFGKGTIQGLFPIDGGETLKVTVAEMYLPSGRRLQRVAGDAKSGVDPNDGFYVPLSAADQDAAKAARQGIADGKQTAPTTLTPEWIEKTLADPQMASALKTLSAKAAGGDFVKVGQPLTALIAHYENVWRERERLLIQVKQLDRQLGEAAK
jgi:carboxyl-terminal processing protease